ncbi:hypothetical protein HPP92_001055 [Vanilla planifolia]|uniref:Uncharacterized protein n=1 Tax=Vanilla planifolia TaxID=51239 RepID=A0A835S1T5_VANPL|nr:hypothetical protein HPP92_001055 [Vanilla planifolia]
MDDGHDGELSTDSWSELEALSDPQRQRHDNTGVSNLYIDRMVSSCSLLGMVGDQVMIIKRSGASISSVNVGSPCIPQHRTILKQVALSPSEQSP